MKSGILLRSLVFAVTTLFSVSLAVAQPIADSSIISQVPVAESAAGISADGHSSVGKEIPVPGSVLFVTPAERKSLEKQVQTKEAVSSKEKRRLKRLKRQDRKEVTDVIGSSVNTYLANAATVHTLQRF